MGKIKLIYGLEKILDPIILNALKNAPKFDWSCLPKWKKKPKDIYKWRIKE